MTPTLRMEREFLRAGARRIAGVDEVGRGAIAGPVTVGVVVVDAATRTAPTGLRDSKLLSAAQRDRLFPRVRRRAVAHGVGSSAPAEIDAWGLTIALRLAAMRALSAVGPVDAVLLDGSQDWLSVSSESLFDDVPWPPVAVPRVHLRVKADMTCSSVAAASVLAKVTRDREMIRLAGDDDPYGWTANKGYTTSDHADAVRRLGLCDHHRRSWNVAAAAVDLRSHNPEQRRVVTS